MDSPPTPLTTASRNASTVIWVILATVGISSYVLTGIAGLGRVGDPGVDFRFLYVAGQTWLSGGDAYNAADRLASAPLLHQDIYAFVYPPWIHPLASSLARWSLPISTHVWEAVNLMCLMALVLALWDREPTPAAGSVNASEPMLGLLSLLTFAFALPFSSHVSWLGQTTLLAAAALASSLYCLRTQRGTWAALFLLLASIKPQISFPFMVLLILQGRWKPVLVSAAGLALLSLAPTIASGGPIELAVRWQAELKQYGASPLNSAGFRHMTGLQSLGAAFGLHVPTALIAVMLLAAVAILRYRPPANRPQLVYPLLICAICTFVPMHDYDYVLLIFPMAHLLQAKAKQTPDIVLIALSTVLLYLPQRVVSLWVPHAFLQYRTLCPMLIAGALIYASRQHSEQPAPHPTGT